MVYSGGGGGSDGDVRARECVRVCLMQRSSAAKRGDGGGGSGGGGGRICGLRFLL